MRHNKFGDNKMGKRKGGVKRDEKELSATPIMGQPETVYDMVNKYGTYEIQPTNDSDNEYPMISQGLPTNNRKEYRFGEK